MAKAFKCDGCRGLEEGEPIAVLSLVPPKENYYMANSRLAVTERAEICSTCARAMASAIEGLRHSRAKGRDE